MIAYIICCNDLIQAVVLDDKDRAQRELKALKEEYWQQTKDWMFLTREAYEIRLYWHIQAKTVTQ